MTRTRTLRCEFFMNQKVLMNTFNSEEIEHDHAVQHEFGMETFGEMM